MKQMNHAMALLLATLIPVQALAEGPPPGQPSPLANILLFGGFILIFYFLMWRPQAKRAKEHRELMAALSKGDEVVTNGGVAGKIAKVGDDFISLEISNGVEIKVQKAAVASVLPKGTLKEV